MNPNCFKNISNFYVAGINYKKSDATIRGQFAINTTQYTDILTKAAGQDLNELFIISTCNRTEIYGFASSKDQLINLLCTQTEGTASTFKKGAYIKQGFAAIEHLFCVGAGLDSQILGDYEIVSQLKTAVKLAREKGFIGTFTDRLVNSVLQASKIIKNATALSGGTVSVSFAAVQYLKNYVPSISQKNILLLGVGKIGKNTCKNLVDYLTTKNITLINRTVEKAAELADELGLKHASIDNLKLEIDRADVILVATNAAQPTILKEHLEHGANKLIIDLSIPYNVAEDALKLPNVSLVNVDELSRLKDETLKKREAEIPKAKEIIGEFMTEFTEWNEMRKHVPLLKEVKLKLKEIHTHPVFTSTPASCCPKVRDANIQRALNDMACNIRRHNSKGCHYIEAINHFIKAARNN